MTQNLSAHRCPICRKPVKEAATEFPFCGQRCRTIDLGNWAAEKYVVSVPSLDPEEAESLLRNPPASEDEA